MTLNSLEIEPEFFSAGRPAGGEGPARQALPDHRRRQRHRPGHCGRRRAEGAELVPHRHPGRRLGGSRRRSAPRGGTVAHAAPADSPTTTPSARWPPRSTPRTAAMDVVMNIAGIATWGTVESLEHQHWQPTVDVNLMGPIHVIETLRAADDRGRARRPPRQRLLGGGLFGLPWHAAYSASEVRPARRLRGAALRPAPARHRRQPGLPGRRGHAAGRDGRDRRRRRERAACADDRALPSATRSRPSRPPETILRGVGRDRYWVYTSPDIRLAIWLQRCSRLPTRWPCALLSDRFERPSQAKAR